MKGCNRLEMNQATMVEAVECYLKTQFQEDSVPKVQKVKADREKPTTADCFIIELVTHDSEEGVE